MKPDLTPHDESTRAARAPRVSRADAALVVAFLTPPSAWALDLGVAYALVDPAARAESKVLLWSIGLLCAAVTVLAGVVGATMSKRVAPRMSTEAATSHIRALGVAACAMSAFFLLAIVALNVPIFGLGLHDR
jgi:hypothetical protein